MSKVKVNLASGNVFEKPLVTCFKGTSANYVVFDNETNGSVGLPIICISKLNGSNVEKIFDQGEWNSVKESLKSIIAGSELTYLSVPEVLNAQDDFFTQLSLPATSFDVLKNAYKVPEAQPVAAPVPETPAEPEPAPVPEVQTPEVEAPSPVVMEPIAPAAVEMPVEVSPIVEPVAPVVEPTQAPTPIEMPTAPAPEVPTDIVPPVAPLPVTPEPSPIESPVPVASVAMPETSVTPEPVVNTEPTPVPNVVATDNEDMAVLKETFLKSCENMFDAIVKKLENK